MRGNPKQSLDFGLFHAVDSRFQIPIVRGIPNSFSLRASFPGALWRRGGKGAIPYLFERLFLIGWENNRDCHITMSLSLKTMEVQIKRDQWNKRYRTVQVYWEKRRRICNFVSGIWIPPPIPLWLPVNWAVRFPPTSANENKHWKTMKQTFNYEVLNFFSTNIKLLAEIVKAHFWCGFAKWHEC